MAYVSRHDFLRGSMAAAAAPLPQGARMPAVAGAQGIIDTHVYLSHWPARRMDCDETPELVAMLRKMGVVEAWAGSFDALIHKNLGAVNSRVAEQCSRHGSGLLVPFGSVNPKLLDWEEAVRRCQEEFRMPGIRVHPTYHDYVLTDPAFLRLLQAAAERGLLVQIAAWMEDDRCPNPLLHVPILNLDVLPDLLARVTNVKVEILN